MRTTRSLSTISKRVICTAEINTATCTICSQTTMYTYSTHKMIKKGMICSFLRWQIQSISKRSLMRHLESTSYLSMTKMLMPCSTRSTITWSSSKKKKKNQKKKRKMSRREKVNQRKMLSRRRPMLVLWSLLINRIIYSYPWEDSFSDLTSLFAWRKWRTKSRKHTPTQRTPTR